MTKPLIDVIVPVYNVERYLPKCVDSLLCQDFESYAVTLVDDGSPDRCGAVCDEYAAAHPGRVRVIHKENGGLSDARNTGVQRSDAALLTFVDSDDHVSPNYLSALYEALSRNGADMAASSVCLEYPLADGSFRHVKKPLLADDFLERDRALEELCYETGMAGYACAKLLRREIALAHPFPVGRYYEDSFTVYRQVMDCRRIAFARGAVYYYLQREGSIQHRRFEPKHLDHIDAVAEMMELFEREKMPQAILDAGAYKTFRACYGALYHAARLPRAEFLEAYDKIRPAWEKYLPAAARLPRAVRFDGLRGFMMEHPRLFHAAVTVKERGRGQPNG